MKYDRASKRAAAIGLGMVAAACIPAGAAWGSCSALEAAYLLAMQGRAESPTTPKDVKAAGVRVGTGFTVSWDLPPNRPASTYTGFVVHFTHADSGETKEYARSTSTGLTRYYTAGCITDSYCTGTFDIKVILQNNCDLLESYSDSVSYKYEF